MSSIGDLPAELLIDIFEKCSWSAALAPLTLSFVCHMWHDIVYTSPRVWQLILLQDLHDERVVAIEKLQRQASVWLANSSPLSFDVTVEFQFHSQELLLAIISILIGGLDRWKSCTFVRGKHKETLDISGIVLPAIALSDYTSSDSSGEDSESEEQMVRSNLRAGKAVVDRLEVLVDEAVGLGQQSDDEDGLDLEDSDDEDEDLDGKLPTFRRLRTGSIALNYPVPSLPFPSRINPMGITVLMITEISGSNPPNPIRLLQFLTAFPEIETLAFDGRPSEPAYDEGHTPPIVTLPKLYELTIGSTCSIRMILSHLVVPGLTRLYLQHLNTDAVIPNQPTGEDGDSEDEAHDYSQSPSSDHATGMGLRMLQKRSNPPLRVLDMDYSDLRTKDFLFCFDHFPLLREFRIVASDMSDKVIEMLAPYEGPGGMLEMRLPHLGELGLYHCQRVTGGAVVNALRERMAFVDQSPFRPRMDLVSVIGCAEVLPEHNLVLSAIFGPRFHSSH